MTSAVITTRRHLDWRLLLTAVFAASAVYVAWHLDRGWVAHDEGTLAQSAERLLLGELPHRDFDELYTGGLTWLNAAAFRVLGTTLFSMRLVLYAVFLCWIPAVFYIATRLVRPVVAAGVTLLCVVWSLPNYPAPLPSWYNLFLTVFGTAALFRWLETRHVRWLVLAGIAGGLSVLVKIVGLYFVAAALLFLVFQAHEQSRNNEITSVSVTTHRGWVYASFATICLLAFTVALAIVVRPQLHAPEAVQFILPGAAVAWLLIRNEWTQPAGGSAARFVSLARLLAPFLLGFALPVAIFLIPFARADALGALGNGVFLLPQKRFGVAGYRMLTLWTMLALVPVGLLFAYGRKFADRMSRRHLLVLGVVLALYLLATAWLALGYRFVWYAARAALPVLVLLGIAVLARDRGADEESRLARSRLMLLASVTALFTLVQFPFSVPIYFCYVAPLVVLLAASLYRYARPMAPAVPAAVMVFLIAFAVLRVNTSMLFGMGVVYRPYAPTGSLGLPRGGLDVPVGEAKMYRDAVVVLTQHARGGYTWAASDCPEIYFLSGLRNPTRVLFDFFDDEAGRTARILSALERKGVTAIALNGTPQFSPWFSADLIAELERRYPHAENLGKFQVRWQ
ncbi:MAG: glycosyltransferase family 39 protein [Gemmatimonadaceae bacterium]|nr:glycosyltransferase family 39 protein [Gemmatimonadaceae bacterium]